MNLAPPSGLLPADRKLRWISSLDPFHSNEIRDLELRMEKYYSQSPSYYHQIDFTASAWKQNPVYLDVVQHIRNQQGPVLELGCGRANILETETALQPAYTGCDFSEKQLRENSLRFPRAQFQPIRVGQRFPLLDSFYAAVFSVYVLEHVCRPAFFLDECARVLRPGGKLLLHCPHFLGRGRMPSQRAGLGYGTGRAKLWQGRVVDAWLTFFDRKCRIPLRCKKLCRQVSRAPGFWVNLSPVCWEDPFEPDHDAIYLTFEPEIRCYLQSWFEWGSCPTGCWDPERIYLIGTRNDRPWTSPGRPVPPVDRVSLVSGT